MRAWTGPVMAGSWPCDESILRGLFLSGAVSEDRDASLLYTGDSEAWSVATTLVPLGHQDVYQAGQSLFIITDQYGVIITDR